MGLTKYPFGVSSFGCPLPASSLYPMNGEKHWWVRAYSGVGGGSDGMPGDNPDEPLLTMAKAFTKIDSGDVIHFVGNVREQLNTPAGVFDVTIIGEGTRPRHADAHTGNNGYQTATWKAPAAPAATTPLLKVRQQGWRIVNVLIAPPSDEAGISFMRDAATGDDERDSSQSGVYGCRFAGGSSGIKIIGTEIVHGIEIYGNYFADITRAIYATSYYGRRCIIEKNKFELNTNHIVAALGDSVIINNVFGQFTTLSIDLTDGNGHNVVTKNYLSGTYSIAGGYKKSNANDEWAGNFNSLAGGITAVVPA